MWPLQVRRRLRSIFLMLPLMRNRLTLIFIRLLMRPPVHLCWSWWHGGPTGRASSLYDPLKQFWASRGFAVLDVNHRGSTGYGRQFRQSLLGLWGIRDIEDVVAAIDHAIEQGWVNAQQVFIRGKSAGGYAVLRLLTEHSDRFAAGACYYGIGNLATLAQGTHKFELRYLNGLLGQAYDAEAAEQPGDPYYDRSPVVRT